MILGLDPQTVLTFVAAGVALNFTPGADVMFASASGISGGPRAGVAAAFGVTLGGLFHTLLAALGLAMLLQAFPLAFDLVRYAGAGYLLYLAVKSWNAPPPGPGEGATLLSRAVARGFVTNALNPKVALFILAFLPQFTQPQTGAVWAQILLLGALFSATGFIVTASYGAAAGLAGRTFGRATGWLNKLASFVFAGLAARLLLD